MEWMATITGDMWVIPDFRIWGIFLQKKEKNLGEQKFAHLSVSNFRGLLPIKGLL
jgi:hypothetical protein